MVFEYTNTSLQTESTRRLIGLINSVDLEIARGIIIHEMQVYDSSINFEAYKSLTKNGNDFGGVELLKLQPVTQPYSDERTIRWLTFQVANSLP